MSVRSAAVPLTLIAVLGLVACGRHGRVHGAAASHNVPGADLVRGKTVYAQRCAACHGIAGMGAALGPPLVNERARRSYEAVRTIVTNPMPPMPKLYPSLLTRSEVRDVSAYVETL